MGLGSMSRQYSPAPSSRRLPRSSSSISSSNARPRQRGSAPSAAPSPAPSSSAPDQPAVAAGVHAASVAAAGAAASPHPQGTLRRGRSLDVICEEVLGEAPLLTNPVRRRRSELIPRARLIPRRAASETRADSRTRARSAAAASAPGDAASPAPSARTEARTPSLAAVRRCSSVRSEEGGAWGATYWRPSSATRRSNSLCCSPVARTPERPQRASSARRSHSVRLEAGPDGGLLDGRLGHRTACTTPQSQRCSRSNSYRCPAPSPFKDPVEEDAQGDVVEAATARAAAAAAATAVAAAAAVTAMTRRPQVLRVTDSATTSSSRKASGQQPGGPATPNTMSPPLSPVHSPQQSPQEAPQLGGAPRQDSAAPAAPAADQPRTFVSQSSVTLRGVPGYDEYLCADHRWGRAASEEDLCGNSCSSGSSSSSSYVTWTKSSLRSTQWQLLHSNAAAAAPAQPVSSCMLKDDGELLEGRGDGDGEGCVAVLAPCPATAAAPAVSLLPLPKASKASKQASRPAQKRDRHYDHRSEFDGLLQYLQDYRHGLRELLVNNNVVIIEPVRASQAKRHSVGDREGLDRRAHSAPGDGHRDDKTCRITGAIIKPMSDSEGHAARSPSSNNTLPRSQKPHQPILRRQFFYHPIKINKELVDAELPDPDTVRNARKVFERAPPLGAKGVGLAGLGLGLDKRCWTDSGSLSSGVSSDLSCCDTSCHASCHASCDTDHLASGSTDSQLDGRETFSSGDESEADHVLQKQPPTVTTPVRAQGADGEAQGNPVSEDVLQKIRACGTTVTYFGGEVIACSGAGPVRSPMTMAIMEEIRRSARPITLGLGASLGIKFRLVKSNSCGSRLELAGQTATGGPGGRWVRATPAPADAPRPRRSSAEREVDETVVRNPTLRADDSHAAGARKASPGDVLADVTQDFPRAELHPDADRPDDESLIIDDFHISASQVAVAEKAVAQSGAARSSGKASPAQNGVAEKAAVVNGGSDRAAGQNGAADKAAAVQGGGGAAKTGVFEKVPPQNGTSDKLSRPAEKQAAALQNGAPQGAAVEDKENRPAFATTWKMATKDAKRPVVQLPVAPPPQPEKFGVMEFEEFQFIDS